MGTMKWITFAVALAVATPAVAQQGADNWWITSNGNKTGATFLFVDPQRITSDAAGTRYAWTTSVYEGAASTKFRGAKTLVAWRKFDCANKWSALLSYVLYTPSGDVIDSGDEANATWTVDVPNSFAEFEERFVCRGERDPAFEDIGTMKPDEFADKFFRFMNPSPHSPATHK